MKTKKPALNKSTDSSQSTESDAEESYEIDYIVKHSPAKADAHSKVKHYIVHWKGYSDEHDTKEPAKNIAKDAIAAVNEYWDQKKATATVVKENVRNDKKRKRQEYHEQETVPETCDLPPSTSDETGPVEKKTNADALERSTSTASVTTAPVEDQDEVADVPFDIERMTALLQQLDEKRKITNTKVGKLQQDNNKLQKELDASKKKIDELHQINGERDELISELMQLLDSHR